MNGKGDRNRTINIRRYDENYSEIKWNTEQKEEARNHGRNEGNSMASAAATKLKRRK